MEPETVSFSAGDRYYDPKIQMKSRFRKIGESAKLYDITNFDIQNIEQCFKNIDALESKLFQAKNLYKETKPRTKFISSLFPLCFADAPESYWSVREEYKRVCSEIDHTIFQNTWVIERKCQEILRDQDIRSNAVEIMTAFLWGTRTRGGQFLYRLQLLSLYEKIEKYSRLGCYTLDDLRQVVKAAKCVIPEHRLVTRVYAGEHEFIFHDLLLFHQFGKLREEHQRLPFKVTLDAHPLIAENLYQFVEEGRVPFFKGFEETGAVRFLEACDRLKMSSESIEEGLLLLQEKSKNLQLIIYDSCVKVVCTGKLFERGLRKVVAIDQVRPIVHLNLSDTDFLPTTEVLNVLSTQFQHLQVFHCVPYSTASEEDWCKVFDLPRLKKIVFQFSEEDEGYLENLAKAIENHPNPPKIFMKNGWGVSESLSRRMFSV